MVQRTADFKTEKIKGKEVIRVTLGILEYHFYYTPPKITMLNSKRSQEIVAYLCV